MGDMTVPFIMLLIVTIALVLERRYHEEKIVSIYEEKLEEWKKHTKQEVIQPKELVGLVYLEEYQLKIEVLDKRAIDPLNRQKYTIIDQKDAL